MMKKNFDPSIFTCGIEERSHERVAYVFQGGGALGSFQVGVAQALEEHNFTPDIVSGTSIGAINAAIMAGNPHEQRMEKLNAFWDEIATITPFDGLKITDMVYDLYNRFGALASIIWGQPGFFVPRIMNPLLIKSDSVDKISFYDLAPLRETLLRLIDFELINSKKVTLYLGSVCLQTGKLIYFNNDEHTITPEHIMASAAIPPSFGAVKIDDHYYWDGAIYSNTPLTPILNTLPEKNTLCFAVNCFTAAGDLPTSFDGIRQREKDIRYSGHLNEYLDLYTERQNFRCAIAHLSEKIPDSEKNTPEIQKLLALGSPKLLQIVQLNYKTTTHDHFSKDYNFAKKALNDHRDNGYETAIKALKNKQWEKPLPSYIGAVVYEESNKGQWEEIDHEVEK